jgi:3alpha(or 20beta)-hydroxysteroid dehydrogenase
MTARFEDRVAVVTGAARGTGLVTARRFAEEGAHVVLVDVLDDAGAAAADGIAEAGGAATFHRLDVTDEHGWAALVDAVVGAHRRIDVLVNNAAALFLGSIDDTTSEDFERILRVNVVGPFLGIRAVSPVMRAQRSGSIINVASTDGLMAHNGVSAYVSSKFALRGLTKTAAIELGPYGVRVNTVCPSGGSVDMISPFFGNAIDLAAVMTAPRRAAIPDEPDPRKALLTIAEMILFLAGDGAAGCTGGDFPVDRGETAGVRMPGMPGYVPD